MSEKPVHKRIRLREYDNSTTGAYHVTICTKQKVPISCSVVVRALKLMVRKHTGLSPFQVSFHDHSIRGKEDYLETWQYIDNNPLERVLSGKEIV